MNLTVLGATGSIGASTLDVVAAPSATAIGSSRLTRPRVGGCAARAVPPASAALRGALRRGREDRAIRAPLQRVGHRGAVRARRARGGRDASRVRYGDGRHRRRRRAAPTLAAARAGKRVLLANKEALVMAGPLVHARGARVGRDAAADRQRAQRDLPVLAASFDGDLRRRRAPHPADRLGRAVSHHAAASSSTR